jgi:hypothetical protein
MARIAAANPASYAAWSPSTPAAAWAAAQAATNNASGGGPRLVKRAVSAASAAAQRSNVDSSVSRRSPASWSSDEAAANRSARAVSPAPRIMSIVRVRARDTLSSASSRTAAG